MQDRAKTKAQLIEELEQCRRAAAAREAAERDLAEQQALRMHSDRLRFLGEMAAGMAHGLNQPLQGIRGLVEHLLIGMARGWRLSPEEVKNKLNLAIEQVDLMAHLIEHARAFSRNADALEQWPVQVNEVIRLVQEMLGAQFRARGLALRCELAENLPLVHANPFSLEEVLMNLLTNARDAVEEQRQAGPGSARAAVVVRTGLEGEAQGRRVKVEVIDQGTGIPEEILDKVCDPFFTTKPPDRGTGLGLAISRSIVERLGGALYLSSSPGQGTIAAFVLPALDPAFCPGGRREVWRG
jgi:C4-dicarboxylate-specific signal transduction histidine kinase